MPKLTGSNNLTTMLPITQITETGNVRFDYNQEKIQELANSILLNGLINPITVKRLDKTDENGNDLYELICGHRRLRAYQYLVSQGQSFTTIPAAIKNGSKMRLQLIENIQRENLSPQETEQAILSMLNDGMTQTQIAQELSKPLSWVHDTLKGTQVRSTATESGVDTAGMSTKALSQLASIPHEQQLEAIEKTKAAGGTVKAATQVLNDYRAETNQRQNLDKPKDYSMTISMQTVINLIKDYQKNQTNLYKDNSVELTITVKNCMDLIGLFEAYQRK